MSLKVLINAVPRPYYLPFFPVIGKDYELFAPKVGPLYMERHLQRNSKIPILYNNNYLIKFGNKCWYIIIERIIKFQIIYRDYRKRKQKAITDVLTDHKIHFKLNLLKYI